MSNPDISVVLPVFNGARTIARAVRSILDQSLRELELIVVDDGSTDDTAGMVGKIRDPRLRLVRCDHRGVVAAANTGTRLAAAPLIARMDADDVSYPARLEQQRNLLVDRQYDVVGCQVRIVDSQQRRVTSMQRYERWINEETLDEKELAALRFVEFPLVNPTILARRAYFEMGFCDGDFPEDYDLLLHATGRGMRLGKVDEVLLDWVDGPRRLTRNDARYSPAAFDRCRRKHLLADPLHGASRVDLWGVGQTGKPWLRWLRSCGIQVRRGYDVNRRQIGQTIHGVCISHPDDMQSPDGTPLIIAVGAAGARNLIRPHLAERGYQIGVDAWFVA